MSRTSRNLILLSAALLGLGGRAFAQAPTFKQYTYVSENSSSLMSVTSPAITVAAGDFVVAFCRSADPVTGIAASSSLSNTWNALAVQTFSGEEDVQASWAIMGSAGSTTFTCTPSSPAQNQSMVVLDYSGTYGSLNVSSGAGSISGASWTSPAFTTTQGTLNIVCGATSGVYYYFVPGAIAGNTATLRGASASSLTANADAGCEDYTSTGALTGVTSAIGYSNGYAFWAGTALSVNYGSGSPTRPNITWNAPASVPRGTTLSATQLNPTANVAGTFSYSPAAGTVLSSAGPTNLTATFTPTNTSQYSTATASVTLMVNNGTPTFKQYTSVSENSSTVASITSPAITVAAGDLVAVVCRTGSASTTSIAASSSPSNTWTATPIQTYNPNYGGYQLSIQASIATMGSSGSTTFTCTPSTAVSGQSMIVLDYSGAGPTVNVTAGGNEFASPYTTPSFSPTQQALILVCASDQGSPPSSPILPGIIAGNTATLRGVSASSLIANADAGCEDYTSTGALSSVTGTIDDQGYFVGTALAINYSGVNPIATTSTTLAVSPGTTETYGTNLQLSGTIAPYTSGSNTATGTVGFYDSGALLGSTSISSGHASINISTLAAGSHSITAVYSGDANFVGSTSAAQAVTINPASQTIAFTGPTSPVTYGVAPITLSASANSGLGVTFSVASGPGSISGNTLTITGVGTVVVAANQAGNANYASATQVTQNVVVSQASQTITFTAPSTPVTYGVAPIMLSASATSGLGVTFTIVSGPGTISGSTLTITGVGTVVVAANQTGNANYAVAPQVTQRVVVNSGSGTPTFKQYTYVPQTSVNSISSITSPGITVASGDFVAVLCGGGNATWNIAVSSSLTNIWNQLPLQSYESGNAVIQASWAIMGAGGSTTFTCTPGEPQGFQSMIVLDYSGAGATLNTSTGSGSITAYGYVSPQFTTSQGTLNIVCGGAYSYSSAEPFVAGTIAGITATLRGVSAATLTSDAATGCEDYISTGALSGVTGSLSFNNYDAFWAGTVLAVNYGGGSPAAQTITFTAPSTPVTYGVAPITLSASATSGLGVTFTIVSGPGTISGSTLTITGVGTVVVAANQAGNANYAAAAQVTHNVVVNQAAQMITFTAPTSPVTYGVAPIALSAMGGASGNAVTFSLASGPGSISGSTLTITGVGTVVVAANQAGNANYTAPAQVTQNVVVNQATPTVTAWPTASAITYGQTLASSILSGGTASVSGTFAWTTPGTSPAAGTPSESVTFNPSNNTAYAPVTSSIGVTVNPATPTISISNIPPSAVYGGSFTPTYSYSGNGSPTKSVSSSTPGVCTVSGNAVNFVGLGTCTLTASATATTDYAAATGAAQSFTVGPATPTINISDIPTNPTYGGSFTVTYSYSGNGSPTESVSSSTNSVCTVSGNTVSIVAVGACTLTANAPATADYTAVTGAAQSFTVSPATPTISISNLPSSSGSNGNFTVAYNYSGNGLPMVSSSTPNVCTVSENTVSYFGAGTCTLQASATATTDYSAVTGNPQSFTVCTPQIALPARNLINTIAGDGQGYPGDTQVAINAGLQNPYGVAVDGNGNVYIADTANQRILEVAVCSGNVSIVAGNGTEGYSGDGGAAASEGLFLPMGVAVDSAGNTYIADEGNQRIRKVTASTGIISTVAGNGTQGYSGDGIPATNAELNMPDGVAADSSGNIYIADRQNNRIRKVTASTGIISTYAGNGIAGYSGDGVAAASTEIDDPDGVALDNGGNLYISDSGNNLIREVAASTGIISTVAGNGLAGYSAGDGGPATSATLGGAVGIAVDSAGNLYLSTGERIREVTASTGIISTIAGNGTMGYSGDGGAATSAELNDAFGVAVDHSGNVYIGDVINNAVRAVGEPKTNTSVSVSCNPNPVPFGNNTTCTATVTGSSPTGTINWSDGVAGYEMLYITSTTLSGGSTSVLDGFGQLGSFTIVASYSGDGANNSSSNSTNFSIIQGTPTISVYNIPSIAYNGNNLAVTYGYSGYGSPAESVSSSTPGVCTVSGNTVNYVGIGTCTLTASAGAITDDTAVTGSPQSFTVGPAPTVSISNIPSNAAFGANLEVEYSYSASGSPTESVSSSTPSVCTVLGYTVSFVGVGTCTLTANASPTIFYFAVTGSPQSFAVTVATPEISVASSNGLSLYGNPVTFTATVTRGDTNLVTFYSGGTTLGTATPSNGTAMLTTNSLPAGADSITASIAAGANYLAATSSAITQSVNRAVDSGTVTLTVSNSSGTAVYTASTSYGQGSTPESVAEALTGANTYVNVTAINDTLNIEAVGAGGGSTDSYTYAVSAQSTQGFSQPSFQGSPLSGNLQGGENSSSQQQVIYSFCIPGPSTPNCTSGNGYDPAGNVVSYSETTMTTKGSTSDQWSFTYDSLNRLDTATTTQAGNSYPNDCWSYDSFGNRLNQTSSSGVAFSSSSGGNAGCSLPSGASLGQNVWAQYNGTTNGIGNNQISATSQNPNQGQPGGYDQAGDVLNDGLNQYLYDGEGRICASLSVPMPGMSVMTGYVYDADGNRVAKGTITSWSCDPSSNGFTTAGNETDYVVGPGGAQVTELAQDANGSMNWQRTYVYGGGALIATYDPVPNPQFNQAQYNSSNPTVDPPTLPLPSFRLTDWLGTMRATTDAYGVWQGGCTGLPFGDGVACNGNIPDPHHFTGKERDTESGNDYFGARYYASAMGRFMSPDWSAKAEPVPYAKLDNPQSLNLYVYVLNNPLLHIDADGHVCGGPGDPCPSTTDALNKQINAALKPAAEDFSKIGGTDANNNHINYSIKSGEVSQYTHVDGDLPNVKDLGSGYSGKGAGVNNPSMENVPGAPGKPVAGPLPEGTYTIGKEQTNKTGSGHELANSMRLTPDAGNDMHGRSGFLMHGGSWNLTSSEGCIVVPDVNVRNAVGSSGTNILTVTQ